MKDCLIPSTVSVFLAPSGPTRPSPSPANRGPAEFDLLAPLARAAVPERNRPILDRLSRSEEAVARQVVKGWSNKEIADILARSEATVKNQLSSVLKKLRLQSRSQLIAALLL